MAYFQERNVSFREDKTNNKTKHCHNHRSLYQSVMFQMWQVAEACRGNDKIKDSKKLLKIHVIQSDLFIPLWVVTLTPWKGHLTIPKMVTLNHLDIMTSSGQVNWRRQDSHSAAKGLPQGSFSLGWLDLLIGTSRVPKKRKVKVKLRNIRGQFVS